LELAQRTPEYAACWTIGRESAPDDRSRELPSLIDEAIVRYNAIKDFQARDMMQKQELELNREDGI